ncbi:DUF3034 family protein [Parasphingorhabdus cellanae]|uniref:DUF3034 family protein n=1 Tax=Parasphingorhabdus cellanae TaxID=2806553 RepID=A0ABX7TBC6_9SPHN|nr:DUF3034 family protein [Parasphingorhabdus cellanae]
MKFIRFASIIFTGVITVCLATPSFAEDLRPGGKLLLTNGIATVEGSSGGGLASWSLIAGNATKDGIGASAHVTLAELPDYRLDTEGVAVGLFDSVELSYARQNLNTKAIGAALGLGYGYSLNQDIYGAKLRVAGHVVYGDPLMPQIAVGVQHKRNLDGQVVTAVGAAETNGTDFYASATKLFLAQSILANATVRYTKANQGGLLGFGGDQNNSRSLEFEGSVAYQLSRKFVVGGEYRSKPNNLGIAREDDWFDVFAAYAINRNLTIAGAYVDLGSIATADNQRGALLSLRASF